MNIRIDKKVKFTLIMVLAILVAICTAGIFRTAFLVKADVKTSYSSERFLPSTNLEHYALTSPIYTYHDDDVTAIVQSNKKLIVYYEGKYTQIDTNSLGESMFEDLKQVKRLDDDTLLVLDRASVYSINLNDLSADKVAYRYNTSNVNGSYFDFNGKNLVMPFESYIDVYELEGSALKNKVSIDGCSNNPIAINDLGDMFFIDNKQTLVKLSVLDLLGVRTELVKNVSITQMVANNTCLYYISNMQINKLDILTGEVTPLSIHYENEDDKAYDLGKLISPVSLSFKGENLLITDNVLDAVQEFKVDGDTLTFTGFAIAENKTAYNRIQKDAKDVEKINDKIAVLDGKKLSVIDTKSKLGYARDNYVNFLINSETEPKADTQFFALGNQKIMVTATTPQRITLLDVLGKAEQVTVTLPLENYLIDDICYQSGVFYILVHTASDSLVYSLNENEQSSVAEQILKVAKNGTEYFSLVEVDVFDNVYLAKAREIYKFAKSEDGYSAFNKETLPSPTSVTKMQTGLNGELFILDNGVIKYVNGNSLTALTIDGIADKIISFSLDYTTKDVYILFENAGYVSKSTNLPNFCINDIEIPKDDYVITDQNAELSTLKAYTVKEGANVYSVNALDINFEYKELIGTNEEYLLICPISINNGFTDAVYYALAGQNQVVLVHETDVIESPLTLSDTPKTAFTTTDVNMYYLPIITPSHDYALSSTQAVIRLDKHTEISPEKIFTFLDKQFYFASVTVGDKTHTGYIPVSFTVEVLSENFKFDEFTIETVDATTLYTDRDLTVKALDLDDGEQIRLIYVDGDVAFVAVSTEQGWVKGYISKDAIQNQPKKAIRNVLLILAVSACVCGTTTYFVVRKKERN